MRWGKARLGLSMNPPAVRGRLVAPEHAVVPDHSGDAEPIVLEDLRAPRRLRGAVGIEPSPLLDGLLIAPEGEREDLSGLGQALETFDGNEAVNGFEVRPQAGGDIEVLLSP